jgi:tetratricopeptide (TPR) repeat protein
MRKFPLATDGEIAVINLESARRRSWTRFWNDPHRPGVAELIVEQEQQAVQFLGDLSGLDRLETLAAQLVHLDAASGRTALIQAQVASTTHRFAEARSDLAQARARGADPDAVSRLELSIDQACGTHTDVVLETRRRMAGRSRSLEDLLPLGALLADMREFAEADEVYRSALRAYRDVSPFAVALVCFQLGVLWGEDVPEPQVDEAAIWYGRAIGYLPRYAKARVHLSEIYNAWGRSDEAEALLVPVVSSGDPEVHWRLADTLAALGKFTDAAAQMQAARSGFEALLDRHLLAFADHGAEFYHGSGDDRRRALEIARVNVANRPTLRAFEQAYDIAARAGDFEAASELHGAAIKLWGSANGFRLSRLAEYHPYPVTNASQSSHNDAAAVFEHPTGRPAS